MISLAGAGTSVNPTTGETRPQLMQDGRDKSGTSLWTLAVVVASLPFLAVLCTTLWRAPFPLSEAVGIFTDASERQPLEFFIPTSSYYRPLFFLTVSAFWHHAASIDDALRSIRLLHIVPLSVLVLLFIWYLRPRSALDAAAATVAVAVLVGAPGLLGNLELPLSYTIVGMPVALIVWMLLERDYRWWHDPAIVALTLVAMGFKEHGLVLAPLVMTAWWIRAPGVSRLVVVAVAGIATTYVVFLISLHDAALPVFEQDIGLGFAAMSSTEAEARFGAFPLWIFAYNSASTVANVLFAEPTEGVFRFVRALTEGRLQSWHVVYFFSSLFLTGLIVWWGAGTLRVDWRSRESRLFICLLVALAACGVLSFDYSRDRLGGMAVPFYALAAFFAIRAAVVRAAQASRATSAIVAVALTLLAGSWQTRAIYTIEFTRQRTVNTHREWITALRQRRMEFADRKPYLNIMEGMVDQGTDSRAVIQRTRYPSWMFRLLGEY